MTPDPAALLALNAAPIAFVAGMAYTPPPCVTIDSACPHTFNVSRLSRIGRWFREVGYTAPILANDRRFDETWALETDDREFGAALVREREAREAIEKLSDLGCVALGHNRRKLSAVMVRGLRSRARLRDPEQKQQVREQLAVLDGVIARTCKHRTYPHEGGRGRLVWAIVILSLALAAGIGGLATGSNELVAGELGALTLRSLLFSVPLALVLIVAMALLLAGRSASHKELCVVVILCVFALPVLGGGAAAYINRALDDGLASVHHVPVLELQVRKGEGSQRTHYAIVQAWREDRGPTQRIRISSQTAGRIVAGTSWLRLTTSPGKLGAERLLALQVEDAPAH